MRLFENFRGDRAMRKFETALRASQHPSGHVSASGPLVIGLMRSVEERTRGTERLFEQVGRDRRKHRACNQREIPPCASRRVGRKRTRRKGVG
jgi:hypothetical protein